MDHLPRPSSRNYLNKPHLGTKLITNVHDEYPYVVSFEEYPVERGFSFETIQFSDFPPESAEKATAVLQSLLFFGLMEEIFRERVPANDFIRQHGNGESVLCTDRLGEYVARWKTRVLDCEEEERSEWKDCTYHALVRTGQHLSFFASEKVGKSFTSDLKPFLEAFAGLYETFLHLYSRHVFPESERTIVVPDFDYSHLNIKMQELGWCPFQIRRIELTKSPSLLQYAYNFKLPRIQTENTHQECASTECSFDTVVDESKYVPKHVSTDCKCEYLKPDMEKITQALESGHVPVMALNDTDMGIVTATTDMKPGGIPYIAISHVWSHGMGSWSERGLPECVIKRLATQTEEAYRMFFDGDQRPFFWIDALCIPQSRGPRRQAISLMGKTYRNASAVLVIDKGIQQLLSVHDSLREILFVIYTSTWLQRLWTLPEMVLAPKLVLKLAEGMFDINELETAGQNNIPTDPALSVLYAWIQSHWKLKGASQINLDLIIWLLSRRTSSKKPDETLALAGLFDIETHYYASLNSEERMARFLMEYHNGTIPRDIITLKSEKLTRYGWRWAPRTFLARQVSEYPVFDKVLAIVTDNGLRGSFCCLSLQAPLTCEADSDECCILQIGDTGKEYFTDFRGVGLKHARSKEVQVVILPRLLEVPETVYAFVGKYVDGDNGTVELGQQILVSESGPASDSEKYYLDFFRKIPCYTEQREVTLR